MDLQTFGDAPLHLQVDALRRIVQSDQVLDGLLVGLARVGLPNWYLGAGAVAAAVWNWRVGLAPSTGVRDFDVVFYDPDDLTSDAEKAAERAVVATVPARLAVDVTNEARVHLWYEERFGRPIDQYPSAEAAIASWPSTATSVGIRRTDEAFVVCAPYVLRDLLLGIVRPNKALVSPEVYRAKTTRWKEAWPSLTVLPW